jgi:hypothetical protein
VDYSFTFLRICEMVGIMKIKMLEASISPKRQGRKVVLKPTKGVMKPCIT